MDDNKSHTQNHTADVTPTVYWGTIALAAITLAISAYFFSALLRETRTLVIYVGAGLFLSGAVAMIASLALTIRGRQELAVKLAFFMLFILGMTAIALFQGRALTASLTILVISVITIRWLFPIQSRRMYAILSAVGLIVLWTIEWINPPWRIHVQAASVGPIGAVILVVILVTLATIQAWGNLSLRWKMSTIVAVLFLGMASIAFAGYSGLQALRYQLSNIYDFMLVPIVAINNADTALADSQLRLENLNGAGKTEIEKNIADISANNKLTSDVIHQYDTEWVTTVSPEFTDALRQAGKLDLQQQELATLAKLHTTFDAYLATSGQYTQSLQAGSPKQELAQRAAVSLQASRSALHDLIDINNQYAAFSNQEAQRSYQNAFTGGAWALGLALVIGLFVSYLIVRSITTRLNNLTQFAFAVQEGKLEQRIAVTWNDEISVLGSTFNEMAARLQSSFATLETRVAERTRNLELAADVGRSVSQVRALDVMLTDAAEIIRSQFNLYYVQVYLTNPALTELILQSGTGKVGEQLLARNHRLPLNSASINGRAATEKRTEVVADTAASATFRPNPLLPDTRSEMAVPLIVGEKVVGVLDMQSQQAFALNLENIVAFEALAGQLAIAIQNATFLAEIEQARAEVENQARRLSRANWAEYLDAIHNPEQTGFVFEQNKIGPLAKESLAKMEAMQNVENALVAPIEVTGEALGSLIVELGAQSPIANAEELVNNVARRVAQQIENLRLLESAERYRAEAEQASRRLTREGWKDFVKSNSDQSLGFMYDLNEVRPYQGNGDRKTVESGLTLPLKVREETVGRISLGGNALEDQGSIDLASAVAERLGAHIESLRLFDQTQATLAQSEKLFEASRQLTQATDLQELVAAAVGALNIPVVNRALLAVFNYDSNGKLEGMNVIANWWSGTGHEVTPIGTHYSAEALRALSMFTSSTPLFFGDMYDDERIDPQSLEVVKRLKVRAMVGLPLFLGTTQIGTLILESEEVHNFSEEDIRLFTALAPQIATVLENRRQFERAQKQAERESTLNVISQKIQSATTVEAVLQIAARELGHALGAPMTIAQLSMKDKS